MKYLGFVLLVLSGYVMAEEVYYCSDNTKGVNGFSKNKQTGQYEQTKFIEEKFKMKLQDDGAIAIENSGGMETYFCQPPFPLTLFKTTVSLDPTLSSSKTCLELASKTSMLNFNHNNGRYILFDGYGYVFGDGDTVTTRIGTCTKF
jgi:hypothetical protein